MGGCRDKKIQKLCLRKRTVLSPWSMYFVLLYLSCCFKEHSVYFNYNCKMMHVLIIRLTGKSVSTVLPHQLKCSGEFWVKYWHVYTYCLLELGLPQFLELCDNATVWQHIMASATHKNTKNVNPWSFSIQNVSVMWQATCFCLKIL